MLCQTIYFSWWKKTPDLRIIRGNKNQVVTTDKTYSGFKQIMKEIFNPISVRLCHGIYCHSEKKFLLSWVQLFHEMPCMYMQYFECLIVKKQFHETMDAPLKLFSGGIHGWLGVERYQLCGIQPAVQSTIGEQQWVTGFNCVCVCSFVGWLIEYQLGILSLSCSQYSQTIC